MDILTIKKLINSQAVIHKTAHENYELETCEIIAKRALLYNPVLIQEFSDTTFPLSLSNHFPGRT